jgi:H+-transporting ATPase
MTPLGWGWAGFVWGYALLWFLLNDRVKLLAYRIFDPVKAKPESDLTPQIAQRAYQLYEREGRHDGHAKEDWEKAEREIREPVSHK